MVDVLGHVAMALVWTAPAWLVWQRRTVRAFAGLALLTAMLPDVDLYLAGVAHHGPTHTVAFAIVAAVVAGAGVVAVGGDRIRRLLGRNAESGRGVPTTRDQAWLYGFVVAGLLVGGLSHVFADVLSSGTGGNPALEPFWPVVRAPVSVGVVSYSAFPWNEGLLVAVLGLHVGLYALDTTPIGGQWRVRHD